MTLPGHHAGPRLREITAQLAADVGHLLDGAGHLPNLERPDDFSEHLLRFLSRSVP